MSKIEREMVDAVISKRSWCKDNTRVIIDTTFGETQVHVLLHGNVIYIDNGKCKYYSFAGWDTQTTRSRLRALGLPIISKKGKRYAYGAELPTDASFFSFN